jgi:ATP-dependent Zn protease
MVIQIPEGDQMSMVMSQMLGMLDVCLAGRAAEELVYGSLDVSAGAASDLEKATVIARNMIKSFGFSEKIGLVSVSRLQQDSLRDGSSLGQNIENLVNEEISSFISESYHRTKELLSTYRIELDAIAAGLIEFETLSGAEIVDVMNGKSIDKFKINHKPSREILDIKPRLRNSMRLQL